MEDPPNNNNNNNKKSNRKTINIGAGAGSFGIGGIVLLGGAIVTATLVSAVFAFKSRRQKQSSSTSTRDEVTSMKEMESKTIHDSSQDEKHNSGTDNDEKMVTVDSNKDQDNTLDYVDSDLESEEADNSFEKIALDSERGVDRDEKVDKESLVASDVDSVHESKDIDKSYENIVFDSKWRDDGDAKVDTESLFSDESATSTAEYDAVKEDKIAVEAEVTMQYEKGREAAQDEVPLENNVSEASDEDIPNGHADEDQETVLTNEEAEAARVYLVKVVQLLEDEKEKEGHSEIIPEDMEDINIMETADHEVAAVVHEKHEDEVIHTSVSNKPPTPSMNEETEHKVEARVTKDDELISNEEIDTEDEIRHLQATDEQPVERQDNTLTPLIDDDKTSQKGEQQVTTEDELINKEEKDTEDEIRHIQVIDEQPVERQDNTLTPLIDDDETSQKGEQQVTTEDDLINKEEKLTEGEVQRVQMTDDQPPKREDDAPTQLLNKEEKVKEPIVTKDSLIKEDDQTHVQSIKEDEEAKDVTVRSQVTPEGTEKSTQEEPTQEEKTGNQKVEENTEEIKTIIGKEQNDSSHNGIEKEDKDSKSASTLVMDLTKGKKQALASKPWNRKLRTWSILVSIWCLFHWYSELPFPEVSLVCSLMFILILLGYRNRTTYLVKYE